MVSMTTKRGNGMSIYVCSDIHGMYDLYCRMLETVQFGENDRLYILGDMIDRGPDGIKILLDVMQRDNVTCLLGNHEHMMWHYLNQHGDVLGKAWLSKNNGGRQTLKSYSLLSDIDRRNIRGFLNELYLQVELTVGGKKFLLSHSSFLADRGTVKWREFEIDDNKVDEDGIDYEIFEVVWHSPWRMWEHIEPTAYKKDGRYHVIGHVPVLLIAPDEWPGGVKPEMPHFLNDKENCLANIDLGCALIPSVWGGGFTEDDAMNAASLCVLDLERYAAGDPEPATYIR